MRRQNRRRRHARLFERCAVDARCGRCDRCCDRIRRRRVNEKTTFAVWTQAVLLIVDALLCFVFAIDDDHTATSPIGGSMGAKKSKKTSLKNSLRWPQLVLTVRKPTLRAVATIRRQQPRAAHDRLVVADERIVLGRRRISSTNAKATIVVLMDTRKLSKLTAQRLN